MCVIQRIGDPDGPAQGEWERQKAVLESPGEGRAVDILHDQEDRRTVLTDVIECADVRMRDAAMARASWRNRSTLRSGAFTASPGRGALNSVDFSPPTVNADLGVLKAHA
jgi:hypothetical protein